MYIQISHTEHCTYCYYGRLQRLWVSDWCRVQYVSNHLKS